MARSAGSRTVELGRRRDVGLGRNIEGRINKHIRPFFGEMPLSAVRPAHDRAFVAGLVAAGRHVEEVKT